MQQWKEASNNQTLEPFIDLEVIAIMGAHGGTPCQAGYVATLTGFRTASPAVVEDSVRMLRRTAGAELDGLLWEFHQMYLNWLQNAGRMEESTTLAGYF